MKGVELQHHRLEANGIEQHVVTAGHGPPVVLLQGFPEFWYAWRHQIPVLAGEYTVVVPDVAQDAEDADAVLTCPVLALWGADFEWVGRAYDVAAIWRELASDLRTVALPDCWHLPHEERPDEVNHHLLTFLAEARS